MEHKDQKKICTEAITVVKHTGAYLLSQLEKLSIQDIHTKGLNSLVTYVDQTAERMLIDGLKTITPQAGFITEEQTTKQANSEELVWVIDPLDGTNNYLHQIPHFAISIALTYRGHAIIGIIYEPNRRELYHAIRHQGAYLNDQKMQVSKTTQLSEAIIATGFPYDASNSEFNISKLHELIKSARGIRRFGSAALDLAYVACGRYDTYYESDINYWDVAAGLLLVTEAGGHATDYYNKQTNLKGQQTLATNGPLHPKMLEILNK